MTVSINRSGNVAIDPLETILELVLETVGADEVAIGNGGRSDPGVMDDEWYVMCYWIPDRMMSGCVVEDAHWEIIEYGHSLRAALCRVIANPRFGQ